MTRGKISLAHGIYFFFPNSVSKLGRICSEEMAVPGEKSFCVLEYHTSKSVVTMQLAFRAKYV